MKVARKYIPVAVRLQVATLQLKACEPFWNYIVFADAEGESCTRRLRRALNFLFEDDKVELHHRPALVNRPWNKRAGDYDPPANDPDHLVYLRKETEHRIETFVRGVRGQRSDVSQRRYLKRVAENRSKGKSSRKPKSRPLRSANRWPPPGSQKLRSKR